MSESDSRAGAPPRLAPVQLPRPLSSFIGRRAEIAELSGLLERTRLLTLVGPPGCGKTRLALEVAASSSDDRFADGVAFVDLAPIRDPFTVPDRVTAALGLSSQSVCDLTQEVADAQLLVVIDNAEHVLEPISSLVERLLAECRALRVLITSREPLNIEGEVGYPVQPLQLPPPDVDDPDTLLAFESVGLFCTRVSEHDVGFRLVAATATVVSAICRRLDGIPLALELAAARVRSLGLVEIAVRLDDSLSILTHGRRTSAVRHRTIGSAIEWSLDLLDEHEKVLFRRLALFPATFDMRAVEAVCADGELPTALVGTTLSRLVDKSLVAVHFEPSGAVRYRQLEVIRQSGRERLANAGEQNLSARHASYYAGVADRLSIAAGDFDACVAEMTADYLNVQAALDWSAAEPSEMQPTVTEHLQWYWALRGMFREASRRLDSALVRQDVNPGTKARLHVLAATAARRLGENAKARAHLERASALADEAGDRRLSVWVANAYGLVAVQEDDWSTAERCFRRAAHLIDGMPANGSDGVLRMHGWPPSIARSMAMTGNNLALTLLHNGRYQEALDEAEKALDATTTVFERSIPLAELLDTSAQVYLALDRPSEARRRFVAALEQAVENDNDYMAVGPLFGLARTAAGYDAYTSALTFAAAARRAAATSGMDWVEALKHQLDDIVGAEMASRHSLSGRVARAAWKRGEGMDIRTALQFAHGAAWARPERSLSSREWEVAQMVALGLPNKEIARNMSISVRTVEVHLAHLRRKLDLHNRVEVAAWVVAEAAKE